jgi:eukaryotic-like serine/threonine-protein kinase
VSWFEAAAYCESVGKALPTYFHWHRAATASASPEILAFASFGKDGSAARGSRPSLMPSGAYDMAGNVKEWVLNQSEGKRAILGGAWNEVTYMFTSLDAHPPLARRESFGFRCARYPEPPDAAFTAPLPVVTRDFARDRPVDDETFRILKGMYSYERTDLAASVDAVDTSNPHWRREKVSFSAAYGAERVIAYLFLPANASPPHQAVVYFPGAI